MLKEITIKNFLSFNNEVTFSMEADTTRVSEFKDHIISINNNDLLKVSSMYGPNGGGKTNFIKALTFLPGLVTSNNFRPVDIKCVFSDSDTIEETAFFVNDNYELGIRIVFKTEIVNNVPTMLANTIVGQSYSIATIISEEVIYRLNGDSQFITLYQRDEKGVINSQKFDEIGLKFVNLSKNKLALSKIYEDYANNDYLNNPYLKICKDLIGQIFNIRLLDMQLSLNDIVRIINENRERLVSLLNDVDIKVSNIILDSKTKTIYFERKININNEDVYRIIPLAEESSGTRKIFNIFLNLLYNNNAEQIFICDDMNSYLHPKLFRAIIELFNSKGNKKNQLIFNSQDVSNMDNSLFRRDEIWFAYRDENYSTCLIPLSNIVNQNGKQIRNDAKYNKQYLEGKYGADPFIKKGLNWYE